MLWNILRNLFKREIDSIILFIVIFITYFYFMPPVLAPYRDAGEFAFDIFTSSISHQPGYPLYNIIGKVFSCLIPGNFAFRLNLLSAVAGSLSGVFLLKIFKEIFKDKTPIKYLLSSLFCLNSTMVSISTVSEMYSLHILFTTILIYLFFRFFIIPDYLEEGKILLFIYFCGLFMTNRMDISLIYPSFFTVFTYKKNFKVGIRLITKSVIVFVVGFSVYIYLYFLSKSDPLINWSDPSDIKNLIDIITRKSYGSTLDLISLKYKRGENFIPNLKAYFIHIIKNFNILIIFSFYGFYKMFKEKNKDIYFFILLFFIPGPFFLYLANMPPNPHSLSIVEPYYLVPNIAILFMTFFGLRAIDKKISFFLAIVSIFFTIFINFNHYNRKNLRITETFSKDILNNLPQNSIIVAKKDVQVFSLWYYRYVEKIREDVDVIAQGLTGAKWYHKSRINKDIVILHLDSKENWEMFKEINNKRVFATTDCEIPSDLKIKHYGLYVEIEPENEKTDIDMISKLSYKTIKPPYNDFFVYDLAAQYSLAITNIISKNLGEKTKHSILLEYLDDAEQLDEMNKNIYFYRGIIYSDEAKWDKALESFIKAKSILFELKRRAKLYKSFNEVFDSINIDISYAYLNMGVCYEKLNNFVESEKSYFYALEFNPLLYTAHYNLAVLYWDKDKNRSKIHLIEALKINPAYSQARYYLEILERSKNPINKY